MTGDRLESAWRELVDALREDLARQAAPAPSDAPERCLTVGEAAAVLGIGRSLLYRELTSDPPAIRSLKIGRARRIPMSAITEYASRSSVGSGQP